MLTLLSESRFNYILMQLRISDIFPGSILRDLLVFDLVTKLWTNLSSVASGSWPSPRKCHGFTSEGERLYLFGGSGAAGWLALNDGFLHSGIRNSDSSFFFFKEI
jgi:hypothetical protein